MRNLVLLFMFSGLLLPCEIQAERDLLSEIQSLSRMVHLSLEPMQPFVPDRGLGLSAREPSGGNSYWMVIQRAGQTHRLDPYLIHAVIKVESDYDPRAVSDKGARGLMQLMAPTAREMGVRNVFDPIQNIGGGARYLRQMIDRFGSVHTALLAYNAGPGRVDRNRVPGESYRYADLVLRNYQRAIRSW